MDNLAYELWNSVSEILDIPVYKLKDMCIGDIERAFEQKTGKKLSEPKPVYFSECY